MNKTRVRFLKPGWIIIVLIVLYFVVKSLLLPSSFTVDEKIIFDSGDTIVKVYDHVNTNTKRSLRRYLFNNKEDLQTIQLWTYIFSGTYTPQSLISQINEWPIRNYEKITLLEWWSIYDIDASLVKKWFITAWEYISYVSNIDNINSISNKYPFVKKFLDTKPKSSPQNISLEGLLYPDTYNINNNQPFIDQLVSLQLKAFQSKVFWPYQSQIDNFSSQLSQQGYNFSLGWYNIVTLASIIEKEERSIKNKPTIAWIFLNRIQDGMRIDADITLCYGLHTWYETCTPSLIVKSINDTDNLYNTRVHSGLTPTPIANPSVTSFKALLEFMKTNNYYYLHGSDGAIYYGSTIQEHNANKQYL